MIAWNCGGPWLECGRKRRRLRRICTRPVARLAQTNIHDDQGDSLS